jgi:uncharacterized delta-60 repeat protein
MKDIFLFFVFISIISSDYLIAQAGSLDPDFGIKGIVITDFANSDDHANAIAIQPNGKIIAGGSTYGSGNGVNLALVRYNSNGSLDITFGDNGKVKLSLGPYDEVINDIKLQIDGKIVVAGYYHTGTTTHFLVARFNIDGSIDTMFGNNGSVITSIGISSVAQAIAIQSDGKILVAGYSSSSSINNFTIVRYNSEGSLDNSFSNDGIQTTEFEYGGNHIDSRAIGIGLQDGKIVIAGNINLSLTIIQYANALTRYNSDGSLDESFGNNGKIITQIGNGAFCSSVAIQSDSKIVCAGNTNINSTRCFTLVRYNSNGAQDINFGSNGVVSINSSGNANAIVVQPDGKYILAGEILKDNDWRFAVARLNSDGTRDYSFGQMGITIPEFNNDGRLSSVALLSDGQIIVGGSKYYSTGNDFYIARFISGLTTYINPQENIVVNDFLIFPNPASDMIHFENIKNNDVIIEVIDSNGKLILSKQLESNSIDISYLYKGIYVIKLISSHWTRVSRFVKK